MIYVLWNFPRLWVCKIGITRIGRMKQRRKEIDKPAPGIVFPVFIIPIFGAIYIEKEMHRMCRMLKWKFYDGDGCEEWFLLPAAIVPILFGCMVWGCYFFILKTFYHGLFY